MQDITMAIIIVGGILFGIHIITQALMKDAENSRNHKEKD